MAKNKNVSLEELNILKEYLSYNRETGLFFWKKHLKHTLTKRGKKAGALRNNGYIVIRFKKIQYSAHRLAWFFIFGLTNSPLSIDHKDGNKTNNRINNFREATTSQNMLNSPKYVTNTTGVKNVYLNQRGKKFRVRIRVGGKSMNIGNFETIEEAEKEAILAREKHHGEFCNHG